MAAETIGFAIQPEDKPELERLVQIYGNGNRSEFLREAIRTMAARDRAERLAVLGESFAQADIRRWGRSLTEDESTSITRMALKGAGRGVQDPDGVIDSISARMLAGEEVDIVTEIETLLERG